MKLMGLHNPYKRIVRPFHRPDGDGYWTSYSHVYTLHQDYAKARDKYIQSFLLIQNDLKKLFEYVEPSYSNRATCSPRIHELYVRTCIEVESNLQAILRENGYRTKNKFGPNMGDYQLTERSHKLSKYEITLTRWEGNLKTYRPFKDWAKYSKKELSWYKKYHLVKHDKHENFKDANLGNLIKAVYGLVTLISAQFYSYDSSQELNFPNIDNNLSGDTYPAIGGYFLVKYPNLRNWKKSELYEFDWESIRHTRTPIKDFLY